MTLIEYIESQINYNVEYISKIDDPVLIDKVEYRIDAYEDILSFIYKNNNK